MQRILLLVSILLLHLNQTIATNNGAGARGRSRDPKNPGGADKDTRKYFKEPGGSQDLGHYDLRYFRDVVPEQEKDESLQQLIQAFLTFFHAHHIEVWLAHGTLLGWWWNGKIMPWDWDLDVQVSYPTMAWLARELNGTRHTHAFNATGIRHKAANGEEAPPSEEAREFLLDINPHYVERVKGDGMNFIDGRFIDTTTGLFVDITALSETRPDKEPGVWRCKNNHKYPTREIYPLRETVFEGSPALVPFDFDAVITSEYSSLALTRMEHNGHRWSSDTKQWVAKAGMNEEKHAKTVGMRPWRGKSVQDLQTGKERVEDKARPKAKSREN